MKLNYNLLALVYVFLLFQNMTENEDMLVYSYLS